jgi:hypothetical protein
MYMPSKYDSETVGNVLDAMERWGFGPNNRNVFCILTRSLSEQGLATASIAVQPSAAACNNSSLSSLFQPW